MRTSFVLPAGMVAALEPELPALAEEIVAAIRAEVAEYDRPMRGVFGRGIKTGVEDGLRRFLLQASGRRGDGGVYRGLGRGEHGAGRSLDALQAAYRIGARVAWRRLSVVAERSGVAVADQHRLAEAIFAYIDELAAESVDGYAAAQAAVAGERQRRREALAAALLRGEAPDSERLELAAERAAWPLPGRLAVLTCPAPAVGALARRLSGDVLADPTATPGRLIVPEPGGLVAEAAAAARAVEVPVGVGPVVAPPGAARSLEWAAGALALAGERPEAIEAEAHLVALMLRARPELGRALATRALAPLDDETPASRQRLSETLLAWLRHQGRRSAVAAELGVHPQTVRYRVARLRELYGARLEEPEARFELELALRQAG